MPAEVYNGGCKAVVYVHCGSLLMDAYMHDFAKQTDELHPPKTCKGSESFAV